VTYGRNDPRPWLDDHVGAAGYASLAASRQQMFKAISGHSQDRWAADWLIGIEKNIRGVGGLWIFMAAARDGWPLGYEAEHGWEPLNAAELAALELSSGEQPVRPTRGR
jgi:hypothetical protein